MKTNKENRQNLIERFLQKESLKIEKSDYEFLFNFDTYKNAILEHKDKEIILRDNGRGSSVSWCLYYEQDNINFSISDSLSSKIIKDKIIELYPYSDEEILELNEKKQNRKYTPNSMAPGKYKNTTWSEVSKIDQNYIKWMINATKDKKLKLMLEKLVN